MTDVERSRVLDVLNEIKFSDKRITNRVLKLVKKYSNIEEELDKKYKDLENIEDELDRLIAISDVEVSVLEDFKKDVNDAFGAKVVSDDELPEIYWYFEMFDLVKPFIEESKKKESIAMAELNKMYSIDRLK